jgi:bifunctional DNA-binding transcriptional regulator/antitoxin component of YhaV-PrlF toxin-antitoxin module
MSRNEPRLATHKTTAPIALYCNQMSSIGDLRVSSRGQMSLPSSARHRWGLEDGGDIGYLDLGNAVVIVPGGINALRRQLLDAVSADEWKLAQTGFGDADLANQ